MQSLWYKQRMAALPRIAVTMGDPAGVGPELCLRLLADAQIAHECVPIVFGDLLILKRVAAATGLPLNAAVSTWPNWQTWCAAIDRPSILDLQEIASAAVEPGRV